MSTSPSFAHPLHHLFSPTTLKHDLSYVDKTYYASGAANTTTIATAAGRSASSHHSLVRSRDAPSKEKTQLSITRMHNQVFDRTLGMISTVSRLDLQNVGLFSIPEQIASLSRLTVLNLSHNCLETLPHALKQLTQLRQLNVAHNRLQHTPSVLPSLSKLTWLDLSHNPCRELKGELARLAQLTWLDLSHCTRLDAIPAELLSLPHVTVKTDGCTRMQRRVSKFQHSLAHSPPSLVEICARQLKKQQQQQQQQQQQAAAAAAVAATGGGNHRKHRYPLHVQLLRLGHLRSSSGKGTREAAKRASMTAREQQHEMPAHLSRFLSSDKACFYCGGPYFESAVVRYRIILHHDGSYIPVKYKLCTAHWSDDADRVLALFSHPSL